jgi:hypothetical protein
MARTKNETELLMLIIDAIHQLDKDRRFIDDPQERKHNEETSKRFVAKIPPDLKCFL